MKKQQKPIKKTNSSTRKPTLIPIGSDRRDNRVNPIEAEIARARDVDLKRSPMNGLNVNPKKIAQKSSKTIHPPKKVDNLSFARDSELTQRMKRNAEWDAKMNAKTKSTTKTAPKTLKYKKTITKMK